MAADELPVFFAQPCFALVIGIGNYPTHQNEGQPCPENSFPPLDFAGKDAQDFAGFLEAHGFENNVCLLKDEKATRPKIIAELKNLRQKCRAEPNRKPLVIVYFSGHGSRESFEDEQSYYLVPWEGERNNLPGTALSNEEFANHLNHLATDRLVVFLDACHAGGIAVPKGAKGSPAIYDIPELGQGEGRIVIGSCKPGQLSYEWKEKQNGIFTWHLIKLLKCEHDEFRKSDIDILDVYPLLRKQVMETAPEVLEGASQEPYINRMSGTGITLACNTHWRRREEQQRKEQEQIRQGVIASHLRFLERLEKDRAMSTPKGRVILLTLKAFLTKNEQETNRKAVYDVFGVFCAGPLSEVTISECCRRLIDAFDESASQSESLQSAPAAPAEKEAPAAKTPIGEGISKEAHDFQGSVEKQVPIAPAVSPARPSNDGEVIKQLTDEDRKFILQEIRKKLPYYTLTAHLEKFLSQPLSDAALAEELHRLRRKEDERLNGLLEDVAMRSQERWEQAKPVEVATITDVQTNRF